MRAIWRGAISFGLVNVPVKVYSATQDHDVPLHQVHDADGGRIRYQRRCEVCGQVVDFEHINRAYDDGEHTVVLTDEDLSALPAEREREIEVVEFVPSDQIDPLLWDRSYFLEPDSKSNKAYVLMMRTLQESDRTAVVKVALRNRTRLAALRVRDGVLLLQTLLWSDEVREANFGSLAEPAEVTDRELAMSAQLVSTYEADFEPERFTDEYQAQLQTLIDAKIERGDAISTAETFGEAPTKEGGDVVDLLDALRRSVERTKEAKGTPAKDDEESDAKASGERRKTRRRASA